MPASASILGSMVTPLVVRRAPPVAVAGQLPDRLGAALLEAAREAFTQGLHLAAASAAASLAFAILVVIVVRGVRPSSPSNEQPDAAPGPGRPRRGGVEQAVQ